MFLDVINQGARVGELSIKGAAIDHTIKNSFQAGSLDN